MPCPLNFNYHSQSDLCWGRYWPAQISFSLILRSQTPSMKVISIIISLSFDALKNRVQMGNHVYCFSKLFPHIQMFHGASAQSWHTSLLHIKSHPEVAFAWQLSRCPSFKVHHHSSQTLQPLSTKLLLCKTHKCLCKGVSSNIPGLYDVVQYK